MVLHFWEVSLKNRDFESLRFFPILIFIFIISPVFKGNIVKKQILKRQHCLLSSLLKGLFPFNCSLLRMSVFICNFLHFRIIICTNVFSTNFSFIWFYFILFYFCTAVAILSLPFLLLLLLHLLCLNKVHMSEWCLFCKFFPSFLVQKSN